MRGFILRWLIGAFSLFVASKLLPGITFDGPGTLLIAAVLLGVVNAVVRPLVVLLTFPVTLLTLGLFLLVINAAMLGLVAALLDGFAIRGPVAAVAGAIIVSITGWVASAFIGSGGRYERL